MKSRSTGVLRRSFALPTEPRLSARDGRKTSFVGNTHASASEMPIMVSGPGFTPWSNARLAIGERGASFPTKRLPFPPLPSLHTPERLLPKTAPRTLSRYRKRAKADDTLLPTLSARLNRSLYMPEREFRRKHGHPEAHLYLPPRSIVKTWPFA